MSNSKLVSKTIISPNKNSPRNHVIDRITPHCFVGHVSIDNASGWFNQTSAKCSCNYYIDDEGKVGLFVDENDRSWCSSSAENDNRAITFEISSDKEYPYAITDKAYKCMINLMVEICQRHGKDKLLWLGDKEKTLAYQPKSNEMVLTVHRWFANKECPGEYIYSRLPQIAKEVTALLGGTPKEITQATDLNGMSEADKIKAIAPLYQKVEEETGMLASVGLAQFCLESGYGTTDLAQKANNLHGMKCSLSGNTWSGSVWDGESYYEKYSPEQDEYGNEYQKKSKFRKYPTMLDSIRDRAAYFIGAKNGSALRYPGISKISSAEEQVKLIKAGVYATDVKYVDKLMNIISRYNLTQYDLPVVSTRWRVHLGKYKSISKANKFAKTLRYANIECIVTPSEDKYMIQAGVFEVKANAKKLKQKLNETPAVLNLEIKAHIEEC